MTSRTLTMKRATHTRKLKELQQAQKEGVHYRWLSTGDMPGTGVKTRLFCSKAALGEVHLMSEAEHAELLEGWYRDDVRLIYDQVPLNTEKTTRAAVQVNAEHPMLFSSAEPAVLSTDLVYVVSKGNGSHGREARSVKSTGSTDEELKKKQLIEKRAWENDGANFVSVRSNGMHANRSKNLAWLFRAESDSLGRDLSDVELKAQRELLGVIRRRKEMRVVDACRYAERCAGLPLGSGVRAFRQLAAAKRIAFDLNVADPLEVLVADVWMPARRK
ncbi:heteromeric transposase endonuclease subunit TnsA [Paraburkholderia sp. Ac-20340]|uniref:TnsA endonuclease C-terminal domain-containing protein n=1 Tax=Paraburkholderia sp. Ac-20340 TaxID=2703888 RepID=UPI00198178A9|nr:TnsA endonuclease C-terminal domain-containing protein [Paraburkholderia sp. Ac-20340]MBN3858694.1 heteromeric transposase endonuclease subunit TnsA [Paraburkholderia sp. Ac-20340]